MEDFFEKIRKPQLGADGSYIRSEVSRLRAYLYTLARDKDRQREVERVQTDLTYWHLLLSYKEIDFDYGQFEYTLTKLAELKKGLGLEDTKELSKLMDLAQEFNWVECGRTIADLPNKDKVCEILFILDGGKSGFGVYRDFALIGVEPSMQEDEEEPEEEQPQTQPRELPERLSGTKAKHLLDWARNKEQGLLDKDYYWIGGPIDLCAFFCVCINKHCDIHAKGPKKEGGEDRNEWKLYERFFFKDGKYKGREVDLSNNFGTIRKIKRETLNKGIYRKILDHCNLSLTKIVPKGP